MIIYYQEICFPPRLLSPVHPPADRVGSQQVCGRELDRLSWPADARIPLVLILADYILCLYARGLQCRPLVILPALDQFQTHGLMHRHCPYIQRYSQHDLSDPSQFSPPICF